MVNEKSDKVIKEGAIIEVSLDNETPRMMRVVRARRAGPNTTDLTLETVSGPDEIVCTCPYVEGPGQIGLRMGTSRACAMHGEGAKGRLEALRAKLASEGR